MPTPAYIKMTGQTQGVITEGTNTPESVGNTSTDKHEDEALVQAFRHNIMTPTDPQSGQPSGKVVHGPVIITKVFDKSSPGIYQALTTGERLSEVVIKWYRTSMDGMQEHYFTHTLIDATIVDITASMPNCQDPGLAHFTHLEDVSMRYRKIIWEHVVAATTSEADWRAAYES